MISFKMRRKTFISFIVSALLLAMATLSLGTEEHQIDLSAEGKRVAEWKKDRDEFFRSHERSPLTPDEKRHFKHLDYFPFNPKYVFYGDIERYSFNINNPKYYAIFLTNKGTSKRYIRYGKFHFELNGKVYGFEVYKSILSDNLFIPFKDQTNGKETYEGGRYIDAEILPGYKMLLDFNMAYFPSCAYNDKFTCALPPKENFLSVEIPAGERNEKDTLNHTKE
jgi:uncharacterized protein (DUF1684 family)